MVPKGIKMVLKGVKMVLKGVNSMVNSLLNRVKMFKGCFLLRTNLKGSRLKDKSSAVNIS